MEDGFPVFHTEEEVRSTLARLLDERGAKAEWAREHGVSRSVLSHVLAGEKPISKMLAQRFGFERVVRYIPIGGSP